jgi:hypothetical protein
MKSLGLLLLLLTLLEACRASRATVEIMDANAPTRPPGDDYLHVGRSVKTTFAVHSLSLPTPHRSYDHLELALRHPNSIVITHSRADYRPGEAIEIEAFQDYEIILSAIDNGIEIYSSKFCSKRQTFRAEEGTNTFTAFLCAKPDQP